MEIMVKTNNAFNNLKGKINVIPQVDNTLTKEGHSAEAKKTGEEIARIDTAIEGVNEKLNNFGTATKLVEDGVANTSYPIATTGYRYIYYEFMSNADVLASACIPVNLLTADGRTYCHREYASDSYKAELKVWITKSAIKVSTQSVTGLSVTAFNVYGIS